MGLFDKAGKFAEKAGEKMAKAATGVADKSKVLAEKTKLKSNLRWCIRRKKSIRKYYKIYEDGSKCRLWRCIQYYDI